MTTEELQRVSSVSWFPKTIRGRVYARFVMDAGGEPLFETDPGEPDVRQYRIDLHIHSPIARDIDYVEYYLLDPAFAGVEAMRSEDEKNDFRFAIATDRDSFVDVTVNTVSVLYRTRTTLAAMLEAGHAGTTNPAVRDAIARVRRLGG